MTRTPHTPRVLYSTAATVALALLASFACWAAPAQNAADPLTYRLALKPGDITLSAAPSAGTPPAQQQAITFTVINSSDTDYEGNSPSCQTFDVEILWRAPGGEQSVWKWSQGQAFCQSVTQVVIPAGLTWQQTVTWNFNAAAVKPGEYRVAATFIPSEAEASAEFDLRASR
jgi:hypothetical protein